MHYPVHSLSLGTVMQLYHINAIVHTRQQHMHIHFPDGNQLYRIGQNGALNAVNVRRKIAMTVILDARDIKLKPMTSFRTQVDSDDDL